MHHRWRALVGFAVLTLLVNVAGPRMHLHPGEDHQPAGALAHSHGGGEPHSHDRAPATPGDQGEAQGTVIVLGAARVLMFPSSVTTFSVPMLLPEPIVTVAACEEWVPSPDTTPPHAHGPPSADRLPARAPPLGPLQFS
jgi:hypothetical protein